MFFFVFFCTDQTSTPACQSVLKLSDMDPTLFLFLASLWHLGSLWPIQYSKDYLLTFEKPVISGPPVDLIIPDLEELAGLGKGDHFRTPERRPRRRGRRGGVRERMRRQHPSRIPLPSIMLSNARSLRNKTDELQALVRHQHAFKDACILAFSETWLGERDADGDLVIDGFGIPFRTDRTSTTTGKSCGGGVCAYINERWCKNVIVRERLCTKDVVCVMGPSVMGPLKMHINQFYSPSRLS